MLQNNQVMGQRHARQILDTLDTNKAVMLLYDKYNMTGLDVSTTPCMHAFCTKTHTHTHTHVYKYTDVACNYLNT